MSVKPQKSQQNTRSYRRPNVCWNCGQSGHHQAQCIANPNQKPDNWKRTAPISNCGAVLHGRSYVYLNGLVKKKPISCLLDSGSDVTLAPTEIIQKFKCEVKPAEITTLKAANGSSISVSGKAVLPLRFNGHKSDTTVLVSEDLTEVILGIDWLQEHDCN